MMNEIRPGSRIRNPLTNTIYTIAQITAGQEKGNYAMFERLGGKSRPMPFTTKQGNKRFFHTLQKLELEIYRAGLEIIDEEKEESERRKRMEAEAEKVRKQKEDELYGIKCDLERIEDIMVRSQHFDHESMGELINIVRTLAEKVYR